MQGVDYMFYHEARSDYVPKVPTQKIGMWTLSLDLIDNWAWV